MQTPYFPAIRATLAPLGSSLSGATNKIKALTLSQFERQFSSCVPRSLFPQADEKVNSRQRLYPQLRTFWCFLWQCLNFHCSCREVVRQTQALFELQGVSRVSPQDGAYCRARQRLPLDQLPKVLSATALATQAQIPSSKLLAGRPLKVVDAGTVTLPHPPANQTILR